MPKIVKQSPAKPLTSANGPVRATLNIAEQAESERGWGMSRGVRVLVYGVSGSGKTTFASTFPEPVRWLICSGGNKAGELKSIDTPANRKRIFPRVIDSSDQLPALIGEANEFATTVLDHATGLADLILKEILGLDSLPAQKTWGIAQQQHWSQQGLQLKEIFRALLNLDGNVVIIAQERVFGGGDEGTSDVIKPSVGAALTPSVTGWLNPACDYVVQAFKRPRYESVTSEIGGKKVTLQQRARGVEYCLRTEPHEIYTTKFRVPRRDEPMPDAIVDPSYQKLIDLIEGR